MVRAEVEEALRVDFQVGQIVSVPLVFEKPLINRWICLNLFKQFARMSYRPDEDVLEILGRLLSDAACSESQ